MKYGSTNLYFEKGSLSIQKTNRTQIREYPGRNNSDFFDLGKAPTKIRCVLYAENKEEKINLESLMHSPVKRELFLYNRGEYYKKVIPAGTFSVDNLGKTKEEKYLLGAEFIALDPTPYDIETGQVKY